MSDSGSTFDVISIFDRAIDWGAMDVSVRKAYAHSETAKRDISLVMPYVIAGQQPTIYTLREVPEELWESFVLLEAEPARRARLALRASLMGARNLRTRDGANLVDGREFARTKGDVIEQKSMIAVPRLHREDLAEVAYQRSFFQDTIEYGFQVPLLLLEIWDEQARRLAAVRQNLQAQSSGEASSGAPAAT